MSAHRHSWIGDDCPPGWERAYTIDLGDPADMAIAERDGHRVGAKFEGPFDRFGPCSANVYRRVAGAEVDQEHTENE